MSNRGTVRSFIVSVASAWLLSLASTFASPPPPISDVIIVNEEGSSGELGAPWPHWDGESTLNNQRDNRDLLRRYFSVLRDEAGSGVGAGGRGAEKDAADCSPTAFRLLAIPVHFTQAPAEWQGSEDLAFFDNLVFGTGSGSVNDYYREVSNDLLDILPAEDADGNYIQRPSDIGWIDLGSPYNYYYQGGDEGSDNNSQDLVKDLIPVLEAQGIDFSQYDNDCNGFVDGVFVIVAGPMNGIAGSGFFDAHTWNVREPIVTDSGLKISTYSIVTEALAKNSEGQVIREAALGVYAHELGHIFSLPDLYDRDTVPGGEDSFGIGRWGLMGKGVWNGVPDENGSTWGDVPAHLGAWSKITLGLLEPTYVVGSDHTAVEVPNVEEAGGIIYQLPSQQREYFLAENRRHIGYDAYLPGWDSTPPVSGLVIWHVDESRPNNDEQWDTVPGSDHYKVAVEQADGAFHLEDKNNTGNTGDNGDPFPGSTSNNSFNPGSSPNSALYDGTDSGIRIENISDSGLTMTVDLTGPEAAVVLPTPGQVIGGILRIRIASALPGDSYAAELQGTYQLSSPVSYDGTAVADTQCEKVLGDGCVAEIWIDTMAEDGDGNRYPRYDNGPATLWVSGSGFDSPQIVDLQISNFSFFSAGTSGAYNNNSEFEQTDELAWERVDANPNGAVRVTVGTSEGPLVLAGRLNSCHLDPNTGNPSAACAKAIGGQSFSLIQNLDPAKLIAGQAYTLSYWTRAGSGVHTTRVTICSLEEPPPDGCGLSTVNCTVTAPDDGTWVQRECPFTLSDNVTLPRLHVVIDGPGTLDETDYNFVDGISLRRTEDDVELVGNGDFESPLDPGCSDDSDVECWQDPDGAVGDGQVSIFKWHVSGDSPEQRCYMVEDLDGIDGTLIAFWTGCTELPRPDRVTNLETVGGGCDPGLELEWQAARNAEYYVIQYWVSGSEEIEEVVFTPADSSTAYSFVPPELEVVEYCFKVRSLNQSGDPDGANGAYSPMVCGSPGGGIPPPPGGDPLPNLK